MGAVPYSGFKQIPEVCTRSDRVRSSYENDIYFRHKRNEEYIQDSLSTRDHTNLLLINTTGIVGDIPTACFVL